MPRSDEMHMKEDKNDTFKIIKSSFLSHIKQNLKKSLVNDRLYSSHCKKKNAVFLLVNLERQYFFTRFFLVLLCV